jgi:hypothetical protein
MLMVTLRFWTAFLAKALPETLDWRNNQFANQDPTKSDPS